MSFQDFFSTYYWSFDNEHLLMISYYLDPVLSPGTSSATTTSFYTDPDIKAAIASNSYLAFNVFKIKETKSDQTVFKLDANSTTLKTFDVAGFFTTNMEASTQFKPQYGQSSLRYKVDLETCFKSRTRGANDNSCC